MSGFNYLGSNVKADYYNSLKPKIKQKVINPQTVTPSSNIPNASNKNYLGFNASSKNYLGPNIQANYYKSLKSNAYQKAAENGYRGMNANGYQPLTTEPVPQVNVPAPSPTQQVGMQRPTLQANDGFGSGIVNQPAQSTSLDQMNRTPQNIQIGSDIQKSGYTPLGPMSRTPQDIQIGNNLPKNGGGGNPYDILGTNSGSSLTPDEIALANKQGEIYNNTPTLTPEQEKLANKQGEIYNEFGSTSTPTPKDPPPKPDQKYETSPWADTAGMINAGAGLFGAYTGWEALELQKDALQQEKEFMNKNFKNQAKTIGYEVGDKARRASLRKGGTEAESNAAARRATDQLKLDYKWTS